MSLDKPPTGPQTAPSSPFPAPGGVETAAAQRQPPSDEQVLLDMAAGQELALLELHRRYAPLLHGLGSRMVADPLLVQRGVEDAFVNAWHNAAYYDPTRASVRAWLVSIAHHRFLHLLREGHAGAGLELHEWFDRVTAPGDQNLQLLALAYYRGEPLDNLSSISGLPRPAVEEALRDAMTQLSQSAAPLPPAPAHPTLVEDDWPPFLGPDTELQPWENPRRMADLTEFSRRSENEQ